MRCPVFARQSGDSGGEHAQVARQLREFGVMVGFHGVAVGCRELVLVALVHTCLLPEASGQVIRGRLLDSQNELPIPVGRFVVLDSAFVPLATTWTDALGQFSMRLRQEAVVMVYASAYSYRSFVDGPFHLGRTDTFWVEFRIEPHPVQVDSLAVTVEGRQRRLEVSGFYSRRSTEPGGVFLELQDLDEKRAIRASDFFQGIPGVHVVPGRDGIWRVLLRNRCLPNLYIDGIRLRSQNFDSVRIDEMVHPNDVEGIEIYRSTAQVPSQYGGTGAGCGVILIWTR
jgi:TonB-dependent Receptor Plug Domain